MSVEIGILVAIICCAVTVAAYFGGKTSNAKKDGERWGRLDVTLENMQKNLDTGMSELKQKAMDSELNQTASNSELKQAIDNSTQSYKLSIYYVHERIDEHLRSEHNMSVPKRQEPKHGK